MKKLGITYSFLLVPKNFGLNGVGKLIPVFSDCVILNEDRRELTGYDRLFPLKPKNPI
ncbi:hypothetical protein SAMN03080598_02524 [Algoriphagus boritolerans DSM 17298 = JCM 18970]|uniref:Uncharacterized protein n=1 Tax=Algoriphagus boritolerans DSM 17298 = JCM 18970 TaxID=1120964 RepID=A0A1H5XGR6_9BACT|nr:hypothetical protein SAMN03080598_02524 [Algoriphagus boritolerans DSM 17298 = JCM 18970]